MPPSSSCFAYGLLSVQSPLLRPAFRPPIYSSAARTATIHIGPGGGGVETGHAAGLLRRPQGNPRAMTATSTRWVKRSTDNGQTWSRQQVIWHEQGNTYGKSLRGDRFPHRQRLASDDMEPRRRKICSLSSLRQARTRGSRLTLAHRRTMA